LYNRIAKTNIANKTKRPGSEDYRNLLSGINTAAIILDDKFHIKDFTSVAGRQFSLKSRHIGTRFTQALLHSEIKDLNKLLKKSLKGDTVKDFNILTDKGKWFSVNIYWQKTHLGENLCILTLIDISRLKKVLSELEVSKKDFSTLISLYEYRVIQRTRKLEEEINERKRIEAEIKKNENLYMTILENYPNGTITLYDRNYKVLLTEGSSFKILGTSKYDYLGKSIFEFMPENISAHYKKLFASVFRGRIRTTEIFLNERYYAVTVVPVRDERNRVFGCLAFARNITEMKHTEHQRQQVTEKLKMEIAERKSIEASLRVLSRHLVRAQENERLRLSHELHDGINQLLSAVKLKLHSVEDNVKGEQNPAVLNDMSVAKDYLERVIMEVRRLSKNLRPIPLEDTGINSALESLCNEFQDRTSVQVECSFDNLPKRLSSEIELTIYRIVQEAIHNVEKHAEARTVIVKLKQGKNKIKLEITDDGKGFDNKFLRSWTKRYSKQPKMGLIGMRERVEFIKGKFNIESIPGNGTKITIEIPLVYREDK
jgi:PAS domain S-box-containing protein